MSQTQVGTPIQDQVRDFTQDLFEHAGGMVDWDDEANEGLALVSPELGHCLGQTSDSFALTTDATRPGLCLSLGGEFVDVASKVLQRFVPARGSFKLSDLPVKKSDFQHAVDAVFGWQNARARVTNTVITQVAYHTWWFHVLLQSEDTWESLMTATINAESQLPIELGSILESVDLSVARGEPAKQSETLRVAAQLAELQAMRQAEPFFARADQRLGRDRKRLRDYYSAMLREASTPNRRTKVVPTPEEIEGRERAVKLELKRKLSELEDRYSFDATIRPIALVACFIPTVAIELDVQRKSTVRSFRLFWNGLLKCIEPLRCSRCGMGRFNFWFSNDDVEPICNACHAESRAPSQAPVP